MWICCSIAHAKFAHKQVATQWYPQHKRETKFVHIAKMDPSPMYSTTLISGTKLLRNRLISQFLLSSNYTSSNFQLRSYSSNGESSNYPSEHRTLLDITLLVASAALASIAIGVIVLSPKSAVPLKQSIPRVAVIIGLLFILALHSLVYFLDYLDWYLEKSSVEGGTGKVYRTSANKIPFQIDDLLKIHAISYNIRRMILSHPTVTEVSDEEYACYGPSIYFARLEDTLAELIFGCNIKIEPNNLYATEHGFILKPEFKWYTIEHGIILEAVRIIRRHGYEPDTSSVHY